MTSLKHRAPPELPFLPLLGHAARLANPTERTAWYVEAFAACGDITQVRIGTTAYTLLYHPDHIRHVMLDNHRNYRKAAAYGKLKAFLGEGLFTSEGELWTQQRRLMQPTFHMQRLAGLTAMMAEATAEMLARWRAQPAGQPLDVAAEMVRLTLEIVCRTLFGARVGAEADAVGQALTTAIAYTSQRIFAAVSLPTWLPTPANRDYQAAVKSLDELVLGIITRRRQGGEDPGDLLSLLMLAQDEETGLGMSDAQLRDEAMTLVLAGHETTANALAWAFYLLSKHPQAARDLAREADEVLGDRLPRFEDLPALAHTGRVLDETLRLYPPLWTMARDAIGADEIGGYAIAPGQAVSINPFVTHRHPAFWENPEGFDPERFRPEAVAARHRFAYLPFGNGARMCIGNHFAAMEAKVILAMVLRAASLELLPGHRVEAEAMLTLRPAGGLPMQVRFRP